MKKILFRFLILALTTWSGLASIPAQAEQLPSSNYDVGMVFYKLIKKQPDFESWVKADARYIQAPPENQVQLLTSEVNKLEEKFNSLEPKNLPLIVRTAVRLAIKSNPVTHKKTLEVEFPGSGPVYFPYMVSDQVISIIPNGIDLYRHIPLSDADAARLSSKLDYSGISTLAIEIVPTKAEGRAPVTMDSVPQWLMLGEIGFIGFYNSHIEELWSSQAPGYIRKNSEDIFKLHDQARAADRKNANLNELKP